jgi:hypothetical protein
MSGGASANTMYDQMVGMFKHFPKHFPTVKINWNFIHSIPIPPAILVNEAVQTAAKMEGDLEKSLDLKNKMLEVELEKSRRELSASSDDELSEDDNQYAKPSKDNQDAKPPEDAKPEDKDAKPEDKDASKKDKIGGDQSNILFTEGECSFF